MNSAIPVSVRKANLFTPQPERSYKSSLGNASTARKSSYLNTDKKYHSTSKPAPDQEEQARILRSLAEYIKSDGSLTLPDWAFGRKFPSSVSSCDAKEILQLLIGRALVKKDYKINKLEIDVPEILVELEYPFIKSMTRSTLVSITNSLAVRNFFILCDWLIFELSTLDASQDDLCDNYNNDPKQELYQTYIMKMANPDVYQHPDYMYEEYRRRHPQVTSDSCPNELKEVEAEIEQLRQKLEAIETNCSHKAELDKHEVEMEAYDQEMVNRIMAKRGELESLAKSKDPEIVEYDDVRKELELLNLKTIDLDEESDLDAAVAELDAKIAELERQPVALQEIENEKLEERLRKARHELDEFKKRQPTLLVSLSDTCDNEQDQLKKAQMADTKSEALFLDHIRALRDAKLQQAATLVKEEECEHESCLKIGQVISEEKAKIKAISLNIRKSA